MPESTDPAPGAPRRNTAGVRRRARELAFRVLFESEQGNGAISDAWDHAMTEFAPREAVATRETRKEPRSRDDESSSEALDAEGIAFAHRLVLGFDDKRYDVDQTLERVIEGWTFGQMSKTDLTVLRLAGFEMMFDTTPHPPVIEVAVRIAKKFGGEESGKFVNGVLARLKKHLEQQ
jgi:transcription antitermination protein NusB